MEPSTHQRLSKQFSPTAPKHATNGINASKTLLKDWNWEIVPAVNPKPVTVPINDMSRKGRNT